MFPGCRTRTGVSFASHVGHVVMIGSTGGQTSDVWHPVGLIVMIGNMVGCEVGCTYRELYMCLCGLKKSSELWVRNSHLRLPDRQAAPVRGAASPSTPQMCSTISSLPMRAKIASAEVGRQESLRWIRLIPMASPRARHQHL